MADLDTVDVTRHDAITATDLLESVILPLYAVTHEDVSTNNFYSDDRAVERIRSYLRAPGFELVVAYAAGAAVGQAFGYTLPATTRWWTGLIGSVPSDFTRETGDRTFAFNELMVHPDWQGRHLAHRLHDELLSARPEERATILVRADNQTARTAYDRWGWRQVGQLQPFPDSPVFDALILPLSD